MRFLSLFFLAILFVSLCMMSCEKPIFTVEKGTLIFSEDTVKFDTIFTTFPSPTEWLVVKNPTKNHIKVSDIQLESGAASEFEVIIDGVKTTNAKDVVIPSKDSIHIFVKMKSQERDRFVEEYLTFTIGNTKQKVLLRAFVLDAYFYPTNVIIDWDKGTVQYDTAYCNLTFHNDKPHVISGPFYVPPGCKLTIDAGAQVFFTPYKIGLPREGGGQIYVLYSQLHIDGTVEIQGMEGNPVTLQGTRLQTGPYNSNYTEQPDQWRGIWLTTRSHDNVIQHAIIKNGTYGVLVDSASQTMNPKLTMRFSKVRNMSASGIWQRFGDFERGQGVIGDGGMGNVPNVLLENCLVGDCGAGAVAIDQGGWGEYYNCTFYNNGPFANRQSTVSVSNFTRDGNLQIVGPYEIRSKFVNCAIWGNNAHELSIGAIDGKPQEIIFENCLVRIDETKYDYNSYFLNTLKNQDPLFHDPSQRDFRPNTGSPLINSGKDMSAQYIQDIRGNDTLRIPPPYDIGAYKYFPL